MYILTANASFDSAHFLRDYNGKCANIHGHRWKVVVEVGEKNLISDGNDKGMVVDFGELKDSLKGVTDTLDHKFIIEKGSLKEATLTALYEEGFTLVEMPFRPTAENLSHYFYYELTHRGYNVIKTTVYETPNNAATFVPDDGE